jgi:hypothetical protein
MKTTSKIHSTSVLLLCAALAGQAPPQSNELQPPVRILASGKPIDVTTGHAAPYVLDFDGDGVRDLLVGEFGDGEFPVDQLPAKLEKGWKQPDAFANGRLRIYKNRGTDAEPRFEDFTFLQAGGADATIPIT